MNTSTSRLNLIQRFAGWLARVSSVDPGKPNDGLVRVTSGTVSLVDRTWQDQQQEFTDALEAWRKNPLARRLVALITSYVVGDGITLSSDYGPLARFLVAFWNHPQNNLSLRQAEWCAELARSGELFITLHTNPADGMSYVRAVSASVIDKVTTVPGDYETALSCHELVSMDDPDYDNGGRTWLTPENPLATTMTAEGRLRPWMLFFPVNRPVGAVRGESDLASVLAWLKRYNRWLEDRVRMNAALRAFLWIVKVPARLVGVKAEQYRQPPEPGSVIVAEDTENWTAITPSLNATDAQADGRAIRWMIVAGGPGTGLVDLGEENANLATAVAMGEQRVRYMTQRQQYFGFILAQTAILAYNRAVALGAISGRPRTLSDIRINAPDIAASDNVNLGQAAQSLAFAMKSLQDGGLNGETFQRVTLRNVLRFAGETLPDEVTDKIISESKLIAEAKALQEAEALRKKQEQDEEAADQAEPDDDADDMGDMPMEDHGSAPME